MKLFFKYLLVFIGAWMLYIAVYGLTFRMIPSMNYDTSCIIANGSLIV